jgi:hypothetical protein
MAKRTRYTEYHARYPNYRLELTDDGILFMQCHTNTFHLSDQELLIRQFHTVIRDTVAAHQAGESS